MSDRTERARATLPLVRISTVVLLLSSYGAARNFNVNGHARTAEEISTHHGHLALTAWLVSSRHFTPMHHFEALTKERTKALLRAGADPLAALGIMAGAKVDETQALEQARAFAGLKGMDLAKVVTTSEPYEWTEGTWQLPATAATASETRAPAFSVVALDFGVKRNILRILVDLGCSVTVIPAQSTIDEVMAHAPDGVFFSNGPGDPEPCEYAITLAREVMDRGIPLFGICLGHQILALASGARTEKMKFGHHGANHPVQNLSDKTVMVTSQNHGFTVSEQDLPDTLEVTHRSLFDGTLQGIARMDVPAYSFQGHPEASPGPHDASNLFQPFIAAMEKTKQ